MNPDRIVVARRERWARLGDLLDRARKGGGPGALAPEEVREFAGLYREAAADLARLRTARAEPEVTAYVERLVAAGHDVLYRGGAAEGTGAAGFVRFLATGFPRVVRRSAGAFALAAALWAAGALMAFAAASVRPDLARELSPQAYLDRAEAAAAARAAGETPGYLHLDPTFLPLFSSAVIANNVQATFLAFALGVTAGLGTAAVLLFNGVLFGAVAALFSNAGVSEPFWTFVAAHGMVEIPAFLLAGAAGLRVGGAILRPGTRTRREGLVAEALDAARLLGGTTIVLVVAGLIEGFVSPSPLPAWAKAATGVAAGATLLLWVLLGGRRPGAGGEGADLPGTGEGPASVLPSRLPR